MLKIKGIHVIGEVEELHEVANKFLVSKSWYSSTPYPHYEIVIPSKLEEIARYVEKQRK